MSLRTPIAATLLILMALLFAVTPEVAASPDCPGDLTGDGVVNLDDLAQLLGHYGMTSGATYEMGDINGDGAVNLVDLAALLGHYGLVCPPPGMVLIPAGEFLMGDAFEEGYFDELPVHAAYVDAFYMDTREVTHQQFVDALNWAWQQGNLITVSSRGLVYQHGSGNSISYCIASDHSFHGALTWDGCTFGVVAGRENHPMEWVSWYGAAAYCNWRSEMEGKPLCYDHIYENPPNWDCNFGIGGYRLPTEAEWEKAARGGTPGHRFPWSDQETIQHARCNYWSYWSGGVPYWPYDTSPTRDAHPCWVWVYPDMPPYTSPGGFFDGSLCYKEDWNWPGSPTSYQTASGANDYGLHDMAGNVSEWCNDWYCDTYYGSSRYDNPTGPASGTNRVLRGGSWKVHPYLCRVAARDAGPPSYRYKAYGFRCAWRTP